MLHRKSQQDDAAGAGVHLDDRGTPGDELLAFEPAAQQHIFVTVARGRCRVGARENLVGRAEGKKSSGMGTHPVRERLRGIDLDAKDRPWAKKFIALDVARHVANRQRKRADGKASRLIEGDERPSAFDEALDRKPAGIAETSGVSGRHDILLESARDAIG